MSLSIDNIYQRSIAILQSLSRSRQKHSENLDNYGFKERQLGIVRVLFQKS